MSRFRFPCGCTQPCHERLLDQVGQEIEHRWLVNARPGGAEGDARFAYAARSHQGEQAGVGECRFDLGQQLAPADETGRLCRQFARSSSFGAWHTVSLGWGGRPSSRPSVPTVVRVMPERRSDRLDGLGSEKDQKNEHRDILRPPPAGEQI